MVNTHDSYRQAVRAVYWHPCCCFLIGFIVIILHSHTHTHIYTHSHTHTHTLAHSYSLTIYPVIPNLIWLTSQMVVEFEQCQKEEQGACLSMPRLHTVRIEFFKTALQLYHSRTEVTRK
jgi:hypothetical protein